LYDREGDNSNTKIYIYIYLYFSQLKLHMIAKEGDEKKKLDAQQYDEN